MARARVIDGASIKGSLLDEVGVFFSLKNNFIASENGWGSPINPTLLGPFRRWKYPNILRSIKV